MCPHAVVCPSLLRRCNVPSEQQRLSVPHSQLRRSACCLGSRSVPPRFDMKACPLHTPRCSSRLEHIACPARSPCKGLRTTRSLTTHSQKLLRELLAWPQP